MPIGPVKKQVPSPLGFLRGVDFSPTCPGPLKTTTLNPALPKIYVRRTISFQAGLECVSFKGETLAYLPQALEINTPTPDLAERFVKKATFAGLKMSRLWASSLRTAARGSTRKRWDLPFS